MPRAEAGRILRHWIDGINSGRVDKVVDLYADDSVLLPTFSSDMLHTRDGIRKYFQDLAGQDNLKVVLEENSVVMRALGGNYYIVSGQYIFEVGGNMPAVHPSRFTLIVDPSKTRPILHHHSSRL